MFATRCPSPLELTLWRCYALLYRSTLIVTPLRCNSLNLNSTLTLLKSPLAEGAGAGSLSKRDCDSKLTTSSELFAQFHSKGLPTVGFNDEVDSVNRNFKPISKTVILIYYIHGYTYIYYTWLYLTLLTH